MAATHFLRASLLLFCATVSGFSQSTAGNCLRFNGTNTYVSIPHNAALNAYPLTITAWVKTLRDSALVDGIVSKYADASGNGYSLLLNNGTLYAFYARPGGNQVFTGPLGINGGFIADGHWHHVAFTIATNGGQLFVDGNLINSLGWTGTAGAPTSTEPLLIGQYYTNTVYQNTFQGEIDEVTLWNRALPSGEINYLKHRRHSGKEDGLLGYWRFDEGSGTAATNTVTNAFHGTITNAPPWVASHAAIALQPVATNCLKLNGVNQSVSVAHAADLDAFPLTVSAWVKTSRNAATVDGIVSKYGESSQNGYSLFLYNGRVRAWYFKAPGNYIWDGGLGVDGGFVADGNWHHVAFVVNTNRGQLFVDGAPTGPLNWTGTPGAPTTVTNFQIGQYWTNSSYPAFNGSIDEVTVWNRALTTNEILSIKNLPLAGNEANLVAYWRLDEGTGTNTADATGFGHTGTLTNSPAWTGSTAYLGDGSVHLVAAPSVPFFSRSYAVNTAPGIIPLLGQNYFSVVDRAFLRRFYDFGVAPASVNLANVLTPTLRIAGGGSVVPTKPVASTNNFSMSAYVASSPQPLLFGSVASISTTFSLEPETGAQLDSVNNLHEATVALSHSANGAPFEDDGSDNTIATRLLHFNGHVFFGNIDTIVTNIVNTPSPGTITAPTHLASQLQIAAGGAYLAIAPGFKFGGGASFNVNLGANGFATNLNGSFSLANPTQFFETNGIRYRLPGAALSAAGMVATNLEAWFPAGFGMATSTNTRAMMPFASRTNVALGPDLVPTTSPVIFTAGSYGTNQLWFAEETKPFWIRAPQIVWRIPEGEFFISTVQALSFVRQQEDDDLYTERTNLVDQLAAYRISNDNYYRNVAAVPGAQAYVRPATNGGALLTVQAALAPGSYRSHFPYVPFNNFILAAPGELVITNDLIDGATSYLGLLGALNLTYARDCPPGGDCDNAAGVGGLTVDFSAATGHFGLGEFRFTPEGGLLAYGRMTPQNLTWGFTGGTNYAQRTSDVTNGACYFSGTFLKADDLSGEQDARRPSRLLHTGYGSANTNDFTYVERPGAANYAEGLANYAGLNFRAPTQGRSVIAGTNTDWYPLTARSKYYVRYGGVSGIHESATFPANLTLYGYPFTFSSYRLSYLDSDNYESRTDGVITLPVPSGFPVEFERMKFLCRGNLDSARLPANIDTKHLVYWNTDLKLMSLQFKPESSDPCSLTKRYLVLGVETKLPFIVETTAPYALKPLHASLVIKSNGNLGTVATGVQGADSRFAVPANLRLQSSGGSFYPITTAGDGYFNNWETPGHPENGFYNVVGRVRVPFFRDVKIHLHVTPTGTNTDSAQLDLMGGWAAEEGKGENRGWNVGTSNYFNTAKFDQAHDGWPGGSLTDYRKDAEKYRPRAQQNWIEVADFDYPLAWNAALRQFKGFADATVFLPVIDVNSRLKELTPGKVDFDFSQDLNLQLPRLKVLDFANDALNEINAPLDALSGALKSQLGAGLDVTGLTSGFRSLQNVLRENPEGFFRPVLEPALDPVVTNLYNALAAELAVSKSNLLAKTAVIVGAGSNGLSSAIMNLNGTAVQATKVFGQLDRTFADADATLELFLNKMLKKEGGNRPVMRAVIKQLGADVGDIPDPLLTTLLQELEPTLASIESDLLQLRSQLTELHAQITGASGDFATALNAANHSVGPLGTYLTQAGGGVTKLLESGVGDANDYFTADPARAKREIRERLIATFLGSPVPGSYQTAFRQFMADKNFLLDQLMDVLFDQVNRSIRNGLVDSFAGAQDDKPQQMKGSGLLTGSLASAKIRGAPTFEGDSLRRIHLDAAVTMNLPDEMHFSAYLDIKELDSATTPVSCIPPGKPAAEVTIGAKDIPLDWLGVSGGEPLTLTLEARWTLQSGEVLGIGGLFEVKGKMGFQGGSINDFGATLAFGQQENYFAAKAGATITILFVPVDFTAGIFVGSACSLDPLRFVDPDVEQVLIVKPDKFAGVYLAFGGSVSLSEILFNTSSCMLDVTAHANYAVYYQGGSRFGSLGGRQEMGVDVDLICIISASAEWATAMRFDFDTGRLTMQGQARVCGKIGACPFCLKACKTLVVTGTLDDGGIDYDIDF